MSEKGLGIGEAFEALKKRVSYLKMQKGLRAEQVKESLKKLAEEKAELREIEEFINVTFGGEGK